jgi:mannose-6-phosphate isomerase-like protein (cupin superfamily)
MGRDMADSFHVGVGNVPPVPNLGPDQGWVGMSVQFLVDAAEAGAEHAEEFVLLLRGQGIVLDGDNEIPVSAGDVAFHRQGAWHGFRNTSASEEAEMIWGWAGAASRAEAGYELRYPPK